MNKKACVEKKRKESPAEKASKHSSWTNNKLLFQLICGKNYLNKLKH